MIKLPQLAAAVVAISTIGGGAIALDHLHVAAVDFEKHLEQQQENDERNYVRRLKEDIRAVRSALSTRPGDEYLTNELADLIDELCEYRADDRLCD